MAQQRGARGADKVRVGVIGTGSIAQIMHLPYLKELDDRFAISALCDVSPGTLEVVGERYGVPPHARFLDYRELCQSDLVDALLICPSGSHVPQAVAALDAGKHVLVEKPLCYRLDEADQFVAAARAAPTIVTVQGMEPPPEEPAPYGRPAGEPGWLDPSGPQAAHWEKRVTASHEEAFKREWIHFHACITQGVQPLISPEEAREDTAFVVEWARHTRAAD